MIPKIIHYCWFGGNSLPPLAEKCIESWRKYCPQYEIKQWNENNFDINICNYTKEAASLKKWAFVSDYARFWILYKYGGLYFDTDVELISQINDIVNQGPFAGIESDDHFEIATGLGIGAEPGMPIYKEIIDNYNKMHFITKDQKIDDTTVVSIVTNVFLKGSKRQFSRKKIEQIKGVKIYPKEYFCPIDYRKGEINITPNTRAIHHYAGSWMDEDQKKIMYTFIEYKKRYGNILGKAFAYLRTSPIRKRIKERCIQQQHR